MAALELTTLETAATIKKEVTEKQTLSVGGMVKMEIGNNELDVTVPQGVEWDVVANVRITERAV